jgi:hypothetical protein
MPEIARPYLVRQNACVTKSKDKTPPMVAAATIMPASGNWRTTLSDPDSLAIVWPGNVKGHLLQSNSC